MFMKDHNKNGIKANTVKTTIAIIVLLLSCVAVIVFAVLANGQNNAFGISKGNINNGGLEPVAVLSPRAGAVELEAPQRLETNETPSETTAKPLSEGAIAAIIIISLLLAALLISLAVFARKKRIEKDTDMSGEENTKEEDIQKEQAADENREAAEKIKEKTKETISQNTKEKATAPKEALQKNVRQEIAQEKNRQNSSRPKKPMTRQRKRQKKPTKKLQSRQRKNRPRKRIRHREKYKRKRRQRTNKQER